jgi:hypothetical protein
MVDAIMYFGEFLQEAYLMKEKTGSNEKDDQTATHQDVDQGHVEDAPRSEVQTERDSTLPVEGSHILVEDLGSEAKWDLRKRRAR